jgi:hypothetical protein
MMARGRFENPQLALAGGSAVETAIKQRLNGDRQQHAEHLASSSSLKREFSPPSLEVLATSKTVPLNDTPPDAVVPNRLPLSSATRLAYGNAPLASLKPTRMVAELA